jgi:hypothetical protein
MFRFVAVNIPRGWRKTLYFFPLYNRMHRTDSVKSRESWNWMTLLSISVSKSLSLASSAAARSINFYVQVFFRAEKEKKRKFFAVKQQLWEKKKSVHAFSLKKIYREKRRDTTCFWNESDVFVLTKFLPTVRRPVLRKSTFLQSSFQKSRTFRRTFRRNFVSNKNRRRGNG